MRRYLENEQPAAPDGKEQDVTHQTSQTDIATDELIDDFCHEVALALKRILDRETISDSPHPEHKLGAF